MEFSIFFISAGWFLQWSTNMGSALMSPSLMIWRVSLWAQFLKSSSILNNQILRLMLEGALQTKNCNFYLGVLTYSLLLAIYFQLLSRMLSYLHGLSLWLSFLILLLTTQLNIILYIANKTKCCGNDYQSAVLKSRTKLPHKFIIVPTILKIAISLFSTQMKPYVNTWLFGIILGINLLIVQVWNYYLVKKNKKRFSYPKDKTLGATMYVCGLIFSSFGAVAWADCLLSIGIIVLFVVLVQGYLYLTKQLFEMYKPSSLQITTQQYLLQTILTICGWVTLFVSLNEGSWMLMEQHLLDLRSELMNRSFPNEFYVYFVGCIIINPIFNYTSATLIRKLPSNQSYFVLIGFLPWLKLIVLCKGVLSVLDVFSQVLMVISVIAYFQIIRLKYLIRFANFITRRNSISSPIPIR